MLEVPSGYSSLMNVAYFRLTQYWYLLTILNAREMQAIRSKDGWDVPSLRSARS